MDALRSFWSERAPRERAWLAVGGLVVAAALIYLLLIEPAWQGTRKLERSLPATRAQSAELAALLAQARELRERPQSALPAAGDARAALEASLKRAGLKPARLTVGAEGDLQLAFAKVDYASWSRWLAEAERENGLRVLAVNATAVPPAGAADIELTLRPPRR
jgi:general secretion pathway protein M